MRYFAEIGPGNVVGRVIVASDALWIAEQPELAGYWVETIQGHSTKRYAGRGMVYVPGDPREFLYPNEVV
jgi:hypothetical protein